MSRRVLSIVLAIIVVLALCPLAARADTKTKLVGYWPLNGDATDASTNRNDGTLVGDVSPAPNRYGVGSAAMRFPGETDAYIDAGDSEELQITGAMSISAWVFLNGSNDTSGSIVTKQGDEGNAAWDLGIEIGPDGVTHVATFAVAGGPLDLARVSDTQPFPTDRWVHVTGVYRPYESVEIYFDGMLQAEGFTDVPGEQFSDDGFPVRIGSGWDGLMDEVRIYERAITQVDIWQTMRAEVGLSSGPYPPDGARNVPPDVALSWTEGQFAKSHDLYFGTNAGDVNSASRNNPMGVLVNQGTTMTTYDPIGDLSFDRTYYWRVDEVNAFETVIYKGNVWSFTVEPYAPFIENVIAVSNTAAMDGQKPEKAVNGSGLNDNDEHSIEPTDMWLGAASGGDPVWIRFRFDTACKLNEMVVWNYNDSSSAGLGAGLKDVTIEYSTDGAAWSTLKDVELAQASGTADYAANSIVSLGGIVARYVRLTAHTTWGMTGQYGLSEVRFSYVPTRARDPRPADGASDVDVDVVLRWSGGREAAVHDVHFNASAPLVATGVALLDSVTANRYALNPLNFGTTYYWRIDERNDARTPSVWQGDIWSFTTRQYGVIDDFESYTDESGRRVYEIWRDGYDNGTSSMVGYLDPPYAEQTIVHGGGQSMPFEYSNDMSPFYSEAIRAMATAQNWMGNGADALRLFFRGRPGNTPGALYLAIEDKIGRVAVVTHPNPNALTSSTWQEWVIPYSSLDSVSLSGVMAIYLGVGDRDNPAPGGSGLIYIDDIEFGHPIGGVSAPRR